MTTTNNQFVLFGAGKAGEFFIQNNPALNIIAIADNDVERHGASLLGIPIISPKELPKLDFQSIIITSQWVDSIKQQLIAEIEIDENKIQIPSKNEVKAALPFQHSPTLNLAHQLMRSLNDYLQQNDIQACLDSGTLLGVMRDNALISWDDDIDFAVDCKNFASVTNLMTDFAPFAPLQDQVEWKIVMINVSGEDCCINIEFSPKTGITLIPFDLSIQMRRLSEGNSELVSSAGLFFAPAIHFEQFAKTSFLGQHFYIPNHADEFLTFMYGNWREPKQNTRITEYHNRRVEIADRAPAIVRKRILATTN
ncbi:LicD family protein [Methylotuvimicrobium alcaliphilum]|uniref:Lipopolysaccharide biosynthesis protein n=1 Tax=Methylotuvimicrobium alcaliphilum (strain DSM 19304 / NCIMB 14124 / VKM B-2133 / 20Z) TaxID=1091494 RepID=G4T1L7_META2|nr:LicD family protein [Methylotuvimicrobium alcaliphilum]CCE22439.1 putative lipopolysaccharide biosynthesis protein [Methylotuvimicrobium alcaliphilum 20Z]